MGSKGRTFKPFVIRWCYDRGLCETDDVICNTVGCEIGGGIAMFVSELIRLAKDESNSAGDLTKT